MSDFEEYIKLNYPHDYERQKRIYPDQSVEDLYSEDYKMWQHQQAIIDDLIYKAKLRESDHQALLVKYQATKKCWEDMGKECESLKAQLNNMEACYIEVKKEVEELQGDNCSLRNRVEELEQEVADLDDYVTDLETKIETLEESQS